MARAGWIGSIALIAATATATAQPLPPAPPQPAATLDATNFPGAQTAETLLHVTSPGRFALATKSPTGTALTLIDMITGPTLPDGEPGAHDGRLDLLLDRGTYKIRLRGAPHATGAAALTATPFTDAAPPALLVRDSQQHASLADLQQRSFWFVTTVNGPVHLEAAGRALADFRLWRNGRDLAAIIPDQATIEPTHAHPLRDFRIDQTLPPGTYLVTAYGGKPLPWADGSQAMPFHLREGASDALIPGQVDARIGPFGREIFRANGTDDTYRLAMAGPATLTVDGAAETIDRKSRIPAAVLTTTARQEPHWVEVQGEETTQFRLRAIAIGANRPVWRPDTYWVTATTDGLGGDQIPATLVLGRHTKRGTDVVAASAPEIGQRGAWRRRFTLNGTVSLLFHATQGGPFAVDLSGVPILPPSLISLDDDVRVPSVDVKTPLQWNLNPGWYALYLTPLGRAAGVADLTIGPPGVTVPVGPPGPPSPLISFGVQRVEPREPLELFGNTAPGARLGLDARDVPVDLHARMLRVGLQDGQALDVPLPLFAPVPTVRTLNGGAADAAITDVPGGKSVGLPAGPARVVALAEPVPAEPPAAPAPEPESARPVLRDGVPRFFDFAENQPRDFTLDVAQGGLVRVETLGRLRTEGAIGTHFVPEIERAAANGAGQNMLLQGFLRAGRYHVDVTAQASAGHAGLLAAPTSEQTTPTLLQGATIRATLPAGEGLLVPLHVDAGGSTRLDLLGLNRVFTARLEDAQGWPLAAAAPFGTVTQDLDAGEYRLRVTPEAVDASALVRLTRITAPHALSGHGPHDLPFGAPQSLVWREPAGRNDPRTPDAWRFTLAAPADIELSLSDGMQGSLIGPDGHLAGHPAGGTPFHGRLPAGEYRLGATSQGRNDRLDYRVALDASQLQPGAPRRLVLPATAGFALAQDQVVSLTSFGTTPVRAVLRDHVGQVLGRFGARAHDWNIAISRRLPAGEYSLDLASAAPPAQTPTKSNPNDRGQASAGSDQTGEGEAASQGDQGSDGNPAGEPPAPAPDQGPGESADQGEAGGAEAQPGMAAPEAAEQTEAASAADQSGSDTSLPAPGQTEITLALPADAAPAALADGAATLTGGGVHHVPLPDAAPGNLILAGAASAEAVVISLEQRLPAGAWRSAATAQGLSPVLAFPPDASKGTWRLSVWPVDGGALPVRVAARVLTQPARPGQPAPEAAPLPGVAPNLTAAHVALPSRALLALTGDAAAASWPGHEADRPPAGLIAPQADDLWLLPHGRARLALAPVPAGAPVTMTLETGARAALPAASRLTAWIAAAQGQPGLSAGHGMGVAEDAAFALQDRGAAALVWNASGQDALRVTATPLALTLAAPVPLGAMPRLAPASAAAIDLPPGPHTLRLDLPPGTAAIAGWPDADAVTVWTGREAVSRTLQGRWTRLLLVNTAAAAATPALDVQDAPAVEAILPSHAMRRFFGAAGSIDLAVAASPGQTLVTAGNAQAAFLGADGAIRRGASIPMTGSGRVTLLHGAGLVACWLDGAGAAPWPDPAPLAVTLPRTVTLAGAAMTLDLPAAPARKLLVRSTAPVILALGDETPVLFPAGAAYSRYVPDGPARLRILSPQDGPLSGSAELAVSPVRAAPDGLGDAITIAAGDAALFGFTLEAGRRIGVGAQAQPDRTTLRLMDAQGHVLASGGAMLRDLTAGRYVVEISVPPDAPATLVRPAILGVKAAPNGPPADVVAMYRKMQK